MARESSAFSLRDSHVLEGKDTKVEGSTAPKLQELSSSPQNTQVIP